MKIFFRKYRDGRRLAMFVKTNKGTKTIKLINFDDFYFGFCDYGFHFWIRLFGRDILYLDIMKFKRKFRKLFGIMAIHKLKKSWYIFFKNSIWRIR